MNRLIDAIWQDVEQGRMLGAVVRVARGGELLCREAIGCVAPARAAAQDDIYMLMSLSKSFTAMLVLRAVEQGRFGLDTPVASVLPAFGAAGKQGITIRHLLTHTAGMPPGLLPPAPLRPEDSACLARFVAALAPLPALSEPGERVYYSPMAGYAVLGQVLVATDPQARSFRDIARQDVFEPLGMGSARFGLPLDEPRRVPAAYAPSLSTPEGEEVAGLLNSVLDASAELPAGGAFGTGDDVFLFAEAMRRQSAGAEGMLLSPAMFEYACRNHTGSRSNDGWEVYRQTHGLPETPANYSLLGGQVRGAGRHLSAAGSCASASAFYSVGRGTTMWLVDPARDLTFVFLSAGIIEGLAHVERLARLSDLALRACD